MKKVLLTGGSGTLGTEIRKIYKSFDITLSSPSSKELDITKINSVSTIVQRYKPDIIIHSAAYTDVKQAENNTDKVIDVNIVGTANIVKICAQHKIKLAFISTDHVFDGKIGNYSINDGLNPVTKYAKSKAASELTARMYDNSLIIRTSFFGKTFPYEKAFIDQWSSKDYVDIIAPKVLKEALSDKVGIVHCASERRTIFEIAKTRNSKIKPMTREEINFPTPKDTSLIIGEKE